MINVTELRAYLTGSADVQDLLKVLAREYHNCNLDLDADVIRHDTATTESDPLAISYTTTLEVIHDKLLQTDPTALQARKIRSFIIIRSGTVKEMMVPSIPGGQQRWLSATCWEHICPALTSM